MSRMLAPLVSPTWRIVSVQSLSPLLLAAILGSGCVPRLYSEDGTDGDWEWVPPTNQWEVSPPPSGTVGEGFQVGQTAPDFRLKDQFGDEVSLWQFYGQLILLDISTIWCGPCQELAVHTDETWLEYKDQGFIYLTVLQQDLEGGPPDQEDLLAWAGKFGITSPVLDDGEPGADSATAGAIQGNQYPAVLLIDRKLKVTRRVNPPDDATVRAAIEDAL